jgi:Ca2+-binding RTX toxin-like protein
MNNQPSGTFDPNDRLIAHGLDGSDDIEVSSDITLSAWLFGGATGNNRLVGGGGNDVLLGGFGNDTLIAGGGRDLLEGNGGDDVLIGGSTVYGVEEFGFEDEASLSAIMAEWTSAKSYAARVNDLVNGGGLNGTATLTPGRRVFDPGDGGVSTLVGGSGQDLFFATATDTVVKPKRNETNVAP